MFASSQSLLSLLGVRISFVERLINPKHPRTIKVVVHRKLYFTPRLVLKLYGLLRVHTNSAFRYCQGSDANMHELKTIFCVYGVVVNCMTSIFGAAINISMIAFIIKFKDLHKNPSIMMACLSSVDLLVNVVAQPMLVLVLVNEIKPTVFQVDLHLRSSVFVVTSSSSLVILTIVSVDRAVACSLPLFHKVNFTRKRLLLAVAATLPWPWTKLATTFDAFVVPVLVWFVVCLVLILISCIIMIVYIKKSNYSNMMATNQVNMMRLRQNKSAKTVLLIVFLQCVLYLPISIIAMNKNLWIHRPWATTLVFSNSFLNSTLYILRDNTLKKRYKKVYRGWKVRNIVHIEN